MKTTNFLSLILLFLFFFFLVIQENIRSAQNGSPIFCVDGPFGAASEDVYDYVRESNEEGKEKEETSGEKAKHRMPRRITKRERERTT